MNAATCEQCGADIGATDQFCAECGAALVPGASADRRQVEMLQAVTVGHYEIRGELGRGGMATVYLAQDLALDRKVAIKVMSPALAHGDGMERFKREARTAASLSHPNIIPIYGVHDTGELLYFVMKYVEGRPLDGIIRELGALPIPMVQAILGQVASAFGYAHRRGVIHRDIKPANILIDDEGWAVVTDFGIAKVAASKGLTMTGLSVGTPTYMSPEQVAGEEVTPASDQYALGVLAYEMLTGKPPYQQANAMAMMFAHVHQAPPPLEAGRPDCPETLRDAVMRMLDKDPANRWPSVEDAIAAIGTPPPLTHDDPTRSQLIELARTGANERLAGIPRTPRSPIPLRRTPARPRQSIAMRMKNRASPLSIAIGVGGLAVAAIAITVALRSRAGTPAPSGDTGAVGVVANSAPPPTPSPAAPAPVVEASAPAPAPAAAEPPPSSPTPPVRREAAPSRARQPARVAAESVAAAAPASVPESVAPAAPPAPVAATSVLESAARPAAAGPRPGGQLSGASALLGGGASASGPVPAAPSSGKADRAAVEQAIQAYSTALRSGSAAEARRTWPAMTDARHSYLVSLFGAGGRMQPQWKISDISVRGDSATARVRGTTRVLAAGGNPYDEKVDARVLLDRTGGGWRIRSFTSR